MNRFVETVVSGAVGLAALFVVGKIAFQAGHDLAEVELRYERLQKGIDTKESKNEAIVSDEPDNAAESEESQQIIVPEKKQSKLGILFGLRKAFGKGGSSVVGNLIRNPENHVIEACVKGREIHVNVKPKTA